MRQAITTAIYSGAAAALQLDANNQRDAASKFALLRQVNAEFNVPKEEAARAERKLTVMLQSSGASSSELASLTDLDVAVNATSSVNATSTTNSSSSSSANSNSTAATEETTKFRKRFMVSKQLSQQIMAMESEFYSKAFLRKLHVFLEETGKLEVLGKAFTGINKTKVVFSCNFNLSGNICCNLIC